MTFVFKISTFIRNGLRNYLPWFFTSRVELVSQPLLNKQEILELRIRAQGLKLQSKIRRDTVKQQAGDARSVHRGYGWDYEESRPYQAGDEPRYMNWLLTAKTGELYMKVYREERRPSVFFLIDRRSSMRFGTRTRLKVTQAVRLATCIAFHTQLNHAAVGGVILNAGSATPRWIKEASGEQAVFDLIYDACTPCPPGSSQAINIDDEPDIGSVLNMLQEILIPGTSLFLISDFVDLRDQHRAKLAQLAAKNRLHAIHIVDPVEQQLPRVGIVQLQANRHEQVVTINTDESGVLTTFQKVSRQYYNSCRQLFASLNITYTKIATTIDKVESENLAGYQ